MLAQSAGSSPPLRKFTVDDARPDAAGIKRLARLRGLDKITGRVTDIDAPAGVPVRFGSLRVIVRYCYTRPPVEPPETTAFIQVDEVQPGINPRRLFSGWMFASSPALSALEHPVYDVWVISCRTNAPAPAPLVAIPGEPRESSDLPDDDVLPPGEPMPELAPDP